MKTLADRLRELLKPDPDGLALHPATEALLHATIRSSEAVPTGKRIRFIRTIKNRAVRPRHTLYCKPGGLGTIAGHDAAAWFSTTGLPYRVKADDFPYEFHVARDEFDVL